MALSVDPFAPSRIYAATALEGVYRSVDGGVSWTPSNIGLSRLDTTGLTLDPSSSGRLFITIGNGLYESADGADTWTRVRGIPETRLLHPVISAAAPSEIFVGGAVPYRSLDGGLTWTVMDSGIVRSSDQSTVILAATATSPLRLYAGTDSGLFGSDDHGESWNRIDLGSPSRELVRLIVVDPFDRHRVFVDVGEELLHSVDGGGFSRGLGINGEVLAVAFDPNSPSIVYCSTSIGGVFRSQDGGRHWSPFNTGFPRSIDSGAPPYVQSMLFAQQPTPHLLAGTGLGTMSRPIPNGQWAPSRSGLRALSISGIANDPHVPSTQYAKTNFGLYKSEDSGRTWKVVLSQSISQLVLDPQTPGQLYAGGRAVFRSLDGGQQWIWQTNGLITNLFGVPLDVGALAIDPQTPQRLVLSSGPLVFGTDDGGDHWSQLGHSPGAILDLAMDPDSAQTIYAATIVGFFKSADGGASLREISEGFPSTGSRLLTIEIDPGNPFRLFAGSDGDGVFLSQDKGESWKAVNRGLRGRHVGSILIDPLFPSTIYAGTDAGVERSVDAGESWSLLNNNGLFGQPVGALALEPTDPREPPAVLAGTRTAGLFRLQLPTNGIFAQFGDGSSDQDIFSSELVVLNVANDESTNATLLLRDHQGDPLDVSIGGGEASGRLDFSLPRYSIRFLKTDHSGPLRSGWVALHSDQPLDGVVIFESGAGAAGVTQSPVSDRFTIPVLTSSARRLDTGLALANPLPSDNHIELQLLDVNHEMVAEAEITLPPFGQSALFVDQIPWVGNPGLFNFADFLGLLSVQAEAPVAAVAIETQPGEFATFAVIDACQAGAADTTTLHFPQFANGSDGRERIVSTMLLVNRDQEQTTRAVVEFRDGEGRDLGPRLFPGNGAAIELEIPPGGLRILETDGFGDIVSGSATVVADNSVDGVLLFSGESGAAGVVPSPAITDKWAAPAETDLEAGLNTGLAVTNLEEDASHLQLTLRDASGLALADAWIDLPGRGQRALFLDQVQWSSIRQPFDLSRFAGWVQAVCSSPCAAAAIRTRPRQFAVFPVSPLP